MADQKYTSKYQKKWETPTINKAPIYGLNQSFDARAVSGEKSETNHVPLLQDSGASGRAHISKPGGIVTRSKHALHVSPPRNNACVPSNSNRDNDRLGHEQRQNSESVADVQDKNPKHMMNLCPSVCTEPGKCQGGGELRLGHLAEQASVIEIPSCYALVGCKSPLLPGIMLVAAVDKRYLPDEETSTTMLGFSGNCIGCGAKGFRYFTEFSQHINLRLATQPKKQKHMKYYIVKDHNGRLRKGNLIPWKVEGRKRSMPLSGSFAAPLDDDIPNAQSATSMASGAPLLIHPSQAGQGSNTLDNSLSGNYQSQSYSSQPVAKRHRWESGSDNETICVESDNSHMSPAAQDYSRVELPNKPWLTAACGVCPVLLLCQHSIPKVPCSLDDIIVSDLLVGCFDPPLVSDHNQFGSFTGAYNLAADPYSHHGRGSVGSRYYPSQCPNALTTQMAILLLIQHLSQFDEDDRIMREEIESLLQDAQLELSAGYQHSHVLAQSNLLTHVQLPVLANLAAVSSKGRVKVVTSPVSLDNAIVRGLKFIMDIIKHNQNKFPKVPMPDYIFMLSTSQKKAPEFCFLVSGIHQARYLTEAMIGHPVGARITDNLAKLEQLFRLSSDALEQMVSSYEEAMGHAQLVYIPFNGFARMKIMEEEALKLEPKVTMTSFQHYGQKTNIVYSTQNQIAKQLVAQVCSIAENSNALDINKFIQIDLAIVVPPISTLFNQTIQKLANSGILADLDLEEVKESSEFEASFNYVIKHGDSDATQEKLAKFLKKVQTQPSTLFILIFDQAQFYSRPRGVLDLPFYKEFLEASNVIPLFVTSAPYLFQTNCSFIDPDNEVYWTDSKTDSDSSSVTSASFDDDQYVDDQDSMYFGLKEYCDSIKWTHQFPLFRQDDAFERMALRTTRVTDDVNVSVLRCYLLIRHYCAAIMWSAGIKPAEPHCTLKTIQIIREIIESPVRNADGSGSMLVIRIPSAELAVLAFDSLKNVRDRLGFQYRFAVIHDNGMGELEIEDYFLKRLRFWKKQRGLLDEKLLEDWHPKCYEELLDLPCIILLSGRERTGETFPRSLKYIDIRLIDRGFLYRSSLELEFSAIACYISTGAGSRNAGVEGGSDTVMGDGEENKDDSSTSSAPGKTSHYSSNYPLPVILVSRSAFKAFQTDFYGYPKHLLLPTTPQTRWTGHGRPHLVTSNPANQSLYYRKWTEPKPSNLVGTQCSSVNSRTVINMRSASGIVISPDIPDVVEEDGMSAVETMCETPRQPSVAGSETEDNGGEDSKPSSPSTKPNTAEDHETTKPARTAHHQRVVPTAPSVASESDNEAPTAGTTDDESDSEAATAIGRYHPRSILFSGLPQVGKTGAYLHFARLLHRMLIKQQKVDVYDEIPAQMTDKPPASSKLPDFDTISKLPFDCELKEHHYSNISSLSLFPNMKESEKAILKDENVDKSKEKPTTPPVTSILLSPWTAYDVCHHCDSCKPYRDGMGPSSSLYYSYKLKSGENLHFLIPPTRISSFSFTEDKQLCSLKLPKVLTKGVNGGVAAIKKEGETVKLAVKTPVMIPSTRRCETGLLNLYHAFEGESHVLLVFIKHHEMPLYAKMWPNHVIVGLPKDSDHEGIGAARYLIKQFATENFLVERDRQGIDGKGIEDIWPLVLMMDDSCVMWQNLLKDKTVDTEEVPFKPNTSLLKILESVESTPDILQYGAMGFRQFSSKDTHFDEPCFSHCSLNTAVILNVAVLQDLQYNRNRYSCEDLNFSLQMYSYGIPSCRFDYLTVAKKRIEVTCKPTVKVLMNTSSENNKPAVVDVNDYSNYVTAPDSEDTHYFSAPAEYLLEKYLVEAAARKLFQTAADNPQHPILAIDNYVNLGPRFTVEYVSTVRLQEDHKPKAKGFEKTKTKYGGLLLFFSSATVSKELLQQFDFIDDAQLCLVCQDRNTLRQEVVRLDLEEHWRFRLRDELQTANDPDESSLFILTGKHD